MYRKNQLRGWCCACFGLGLIMGFRLASGILCICGGCTMVVLGLLLVRRR